MKNRNQKPDRNQKPKTALLTVRADHPTEKTTRAEKITGADLRVKRGSV